MPCAIDRRIDVQPPFANSGCAGPIGAICQAAPQGPSPLAEIGRHGLNPYRAKPAQFANQAKGVLVQRGLNNWQGPGVLKNHPDPSPRVKAKSAIQSAPAKLVAQLHQLPFALP